MFRGKKTFRYFNNREGKENECISNFSNERDFLVQRSFEGGRQYIKFESCESFYVWYSGIPESERSFFEVIRNSEQKFRIDIDYIIDDVEHFVEVLIQILDEIGIEDPRILIYSISTSYHIVLTNYSFTSHLQCKYIASLVEKYFEIDMAIYNKLQHFRIEGCTKFGESRWKRRLGSTLDVNNFHEGIISSTKNTTLVTVKIPILTRNATSQTCNEIPEGFSVRRKEGSLVSLNRMYPSYCNQCRRVHDNENAFIIGNKFYCWRMHSSKF